MASSPDSRPSASIGMETWSAAHERLVTNLVALIQIPTVNPPDPPGPELAAARLIESWLIEAGLEPTVYEPVPGRGSVVARLHGDGTGGDPLLLLSHLDVVPAPTGRWTHDPFSGAIEDGYVYGRGAVDMKDLVAMEVEVMRLLAAETRASGFDPARDPVPGLRRDVLLAVTADEEAGGADGVGWLADHHPEHLLAAGALNESGGVSIDVGGRRLYPIQIAEKGYAAYVITVEGAWGHGSMPRPDNAVVLAAEVVQRLSVPGRASISPVMRTFFESAADALGGEAAGLVRAIASGDTTRAEAALDRLCTPVYARAARALIRDTISPNVVHAGIKYNVIPGEAVIELRAVDQDVGVDGCGLSYGSENGRRSGDVEAELPGVPDDADNLVRCLAAFEIDVYAQRIRAGKVALRESLVDQRDAFVCAGVELIEEASAFQRDAEGLEVIAADRVLHGRAFLRFAVASVGAELAVAEQRQTGDRADGEDARDFA